MVPTVRTSRKVDWTDDKYVRALGEALQAGDASAHTMASRFGKKFPEVDVTKDSIIGALNRKHVLASLKRLFPANADTFIASYRSNAPKTYKKPVQRKKSTGAPVRRVRPAQPAPRKVKTTIEQVPVVIPDLKPVKRRDGSTTQIEHISEFTCVFPIGDPQDPDFAFCGRGRMRGSFCEDHARLAYQPQKERKK